MYNLQAGPITGPAFLIITTGDLSLRGIVPDYIETWKGEIEIIFVYLLKSIRYRNCPKQFYFVF